MPATSALVIGGSLAGMCAARVLSDVFDKVTIIERDCLSLGARLSTGRSASPSRSQSARSRTARVREFLPWLRSPDA